MKIKTEWKMKSEFECNRLVWMNGAGMSQNERMVINYQKERIGELMKLMKPNANA